MKISWQSRKHRCRYEKASEQYKMDEPKIEDIFKYTKECMNKLGLDTARINSIEDVLRTPPYNDEFYNNIKNEYNLGDERDIVWMKFTKNKKHLGVVADSNDINFDIPSEKSEYCNEAEKGNWVYNFSGIIVHSLGETWNNQFVWVFPLVNLKELTYTRHYVEKEIGNYLISKKVPILDYYSHKLGRR